MASVEDEPWEEDEMLCVIEITDVVDPDFINKPLDSCKVVGVESEAPILQLDNRVFRGEYKDVVGTYVLFEEQPDAANKNMQLKYKYKTRKKLSMQRVFLTSKKDGGKEMSRKETSIVNDVHSPSDTDVAEHGVPADDVMDSTGSRVNDGEQTLENSRKTRERPIGTVTRDSATGNVVDYVGERRSTGDDVMDSNCERNRVNDYERTLESSAARTLESSAAVTQETRDTTKCRSADDVTEHRPTVEVVKDSVSAGNCMKDIDQTPESSTAMTLETSIVPVISDSFEGNGVNNTEQMPTVLEGSSRSTDNCTGLRSLSTVGETGGVASDHMPTETCGELTEMENVMDTT